jgi:hypothetical protein
MDNSNQTSPADIIARSGTPWSVFPGDGGNLRIFNRSPFGRRHASLLAVVYGHDADAWAKANLMAAGPELRAASQELYDRLQDYLGVPDSELPDSLVKGMDRLEAAWAKADRTPPDSPHPADVSAVTEEAVRAFGTALAKRFPAARSGDLSPERTIGLQVAMEQAAEEWIRNNVLPQPADGNAA